MKRLITWIVVVLLIGGALAGAPYARSYWQTRSRPDFREVVAGTGDITQVVNSTGTVQPIRRVQVGSFVSGPIQEMFVDFNSIVKKGDLMARLDPRNYQSALARDKALRASAGAEVARVTAQLSQSRNEEQRAIALRKTKKDYLSDAEMDRLQFTRQSLEAQLGAAEAQVAQAEAALSTSTTNVGYTEIRSPVDGVVIDRHVDEGQTIAAQFQTPVLFVVAPEMEQRMFIYASVDEADIGLIRRAKEENRGVRFTVDAYPEENFSGAIQQIRVDPTTSQNVVTYTVVVEAANRQLRLMPGMTANLSFQVNVHKNVLRLPNAAMRFFPKVEQVRPEDRELLEGSGEEDLPAEVSAAEGATGHVRYVWVADGERLRAVRVNTGISDKNYTEIISGGITTGEQVVVGVRAKAQ